LRRGDRTQCLLRDADVVVTNWSDARLSWPRRRTIGHRGGSRLLVEDELARAIKSESALAVGYWWGVTGSMVCLWRRALEVEGRAGTPGSQRLIQAAAERGAEAMKAHEFTEAERKAKSKIAFELNLVRNLASGYQEPTWGPEDLALLGTMSDAELALLLGRRETAVRMVRTRRSIPKA
jgi:hypothetical protein